jgi:hypothetical protein
MNQNIFQSRHAFALGQRQDLEFRQIDGRHGNENGAGSLANICSPVKLLSINSHSVILLAGNAGTMTDTLEKVSNQDSGGVARLSTGRADGLQPGMVIIATAGVPRASVTVRSRSGKFIS